MVMAVNVFLQRVSLGRCQEIPSHGSMYLEGGVEGRKTSSLTVSHCHHSFPFLFDEFDFVLSNKKPVRLGCELGFALDIYAELVDLVGFCHVLIEISALLLIKRLILGFIQVIRLFIRIPDQRRNVYPPGNYISLAKALLKMIFLSHGGICQKS